MFQNMIRIRGDIDDLGRAVRSARKAEGFTQEQVALASGVARGVVVRLETGSGGVRLESALAILSALSLDIALLPRAPVGGTSQLDAG